MSYIIVLSALCCLLIQRTSSASLAILDQQDVELFGGQSKPERQPRPMEPGLDLSGTQNAPSHLQVTSPLGHLCSNLQVFDHECAKMHTMNRNSGCYLAIQDN